MAKAQLAVEHNEKYVAEVRTNHQALVEEHKTLAAQFVETKQSLGRQEAKEPEPCVFLNLLSWSSDVDHGPGS